MLVCTAQSLLLHIQVSNYRDCLNAVFADAQGRVEYNGGYCARLDEGGKDLHVGGADGDKERGAPPASLG